jgi:hypothetical protein
MRPLHEKSTAAIRAILIISSLAIGLGLGVLLSRGIRLTGVLGADIADLGVAYQEEYIVLVGAAYSVDHDLEKAEAQLAQLNAPNIQLWVANLAERYITEGADTADILALVELAQAMGVDSARMAAYRVEPTPANEASPTGTLAPTRLPTDEPTSTRVLPADTPVQPSDTPSPPTDTPVQPSDTPAPPTETPTAESTLIASAVPPTDAPLPPPTSTPRPTNPPQPTEPSSPVWTWTARLVGPGQEGQECSGYGTKMIRVTVLDAAGNQEPGVWVHESFSGLYQVSGHKQDDPYWGPGEVEFSALDGGRVCIAAGDGGGCVSDFTRDLPCHDPPPIDDLWAAGYCECCEAGITKERCQELLESGSCLGAGWYYWRVEFKRSP